MNAKIITVVGATGFLGRYVVKLLADSGYRIRVIARNPNSAVFLKTYGEIGQITIYPGNVTRPESFTSALAGSYALINLVGILFENGTQTFSAIHAQAAEKLAQCASQAGVSRFVHVSSLGVDKASKSHYARTKLMGEKAVKAAFSNVTILRPSVLFGKGDNFFTLFAQMASITHALPLIGEGKTLFQPIYVGDVAKAVLHAVEYPECVGNTYELGGDAILSMRQILEYIFKTLRRDIRFIHLPFEIASVMGSLADWASTSIFTKKRYFNPPLTADQVALLHYDNVVSADAKTLCDLCVVTTPYELIVPQYIARFTK